MRGSILSSRLFRRSRKGSELLPLQSGCGRWRQSRTDGVLRASGRKHFRLFGGSDENVNRHRRNFSLCVTQLDRLITIGHRTVSSDVKRVVIMRGITYGIENIVNDLTQLLRNGRTSLCAITDWKDLKNLLFFLLWFLPESLWCTQIKVDLFSWSQFRLRFTTFAPQLRYCGGLRGSTTSFLRMRDHIGRGHGFSHAIVPFGCAVQ